MQYVTKDIQGELKTEFQNRNGDTVVVYVNLLMEANEETHYSRLYLKIRTNRFVQRGENEWMRILDFKNKKNEFYLTIDSPFAKGQFDDSEDYESQGWTVPKVRTLFGVDVEKVWRSVVDSNCTWELEEVVM